jgi:hypothetical protein
LNAATAADTDTDRQTNNKAVTLGWLIADNQYQANGVEGCLQTCAVLCSCEWCGQGSSVLLLCCVNSRQPCCRLLEFHPRVICTSAADAAALSVSRHRSGLVPEAVFSLKGSYLDNCCCMQLSASRAYCHVNRDAWLDTLCNARTWRGPVAGR